jgi:hypothetical protein
MADKFARFPSSSSSGASQSSTSAYSSMQANNSGPGAPQGFKKTMESFDQQSAATIAAKKADEKTSIERAFGPIKKDPFKSGAKPGTAPATTPATSYGPGVASTPDANYFKSLGMDGAQAAMLAYSALSAAQASATQAALSTIGQMAATAAAALKLSNDLNDATVSFMKNIGSSVKAAAQ